jgi:thioesterase domain-containing protein
MIEIVCLQKGDESASLYCLPTASGSANAYLEVATALAPDHAVYGIEVSERARTNSFDKFTSLLEMSESIVPILLAHRRTGPICLMGYSFAGHLAIQVAQCLARAGRSVSLLAVVDAMPSWMSFSLVFRVRHFTRYVGPWLLKIGTRSVTDERHRSDYVRSILQTIRRQHMFEGEGWFTNLTEARQTFLLRTLAFSYNYSFEGTYDGTIFLFRPADAVYDSPLRTGQLGDFGWQQVTGANVRVVKISGDHSSCLQGSNAICLANELRLAFGKGGLPEPCVTRAS